MKVLHSARGRGGAQRLQRAWRKRASLRQRICAATVCVLLLGCYGLEYGNGRTGAAPPTPITVTLPAGSTTCSSRFSSEDVWPGFFYDQTASDGSPTLTQRIDASGLDYWRVQAVPGYDDGSTSLPSPAAYTTPQNHNISAWSFGTLDKVLSDGPATATRLLDLTQPPDVLWSGTNGGQGALLDQSYSALATYYANVVRYFRTGILQNNSGGTVTYTSTSLTDTAKDFTSYGSGGYAVTATVNDDNGFPDWVIGTITSVTNGGHTLNFSGGWSTSKSVGSISSRTPAAGAAYNLASTTPPVTSPTSATPWPRPASVGNVQYFELFNESDLSNSNFPRTSPALPAPTPTLTGINTAGGTLSPGTTYAYRITAVNIGAAESLAGTEQSITLPAGDNAVRINWSATSNLGLSPFAYRIYGRASGSEQAMVVVGENAASGLTWTDKGTVAPSGSLPASDNTAGFQVWRPQEYTRMWNVVAPAIKTVDANAKVVGPVISNPQSLAPLSTVRTAITTGPSDTSWKDSTDYIPYLMAHGTPAPDVVSYHGYGNWNGSGSSDASYFSGIDSSISDFLSVDQNALGSTPAWNTETNIDAGFLDANDFRSETQLGSAWLADELIQYCRQAPAVQQLFQFEVANTNTWNLFGETPPGDCYPQPACLNSTAGEPNLEYWLIYWMSRYFPAGSNVVPVTNVPSGFAAYAIQPPDSTKTTVIVVNTQVGADPGVGVAGSATVQLSGATSTDTQQIMIDGTTSMANGPTLTDLGAESSVSLNMAGYGVAILSFDTGSADSDTTAPSTPSNLHSTTTTSSSASLAWNSATDNVGGSGVAGYRLYRDGTLAATITAGSGTSYTDSGLSADATYAYTISAYDYAGNESARSSVVNITTSGASPPPGDCNGDGHVTVIDLSILLSHYAGVYPACDFNSDGVVNILDLSTLLSHYGT